MTRPNFLHIGAAKCASSWLWRVCKEHPQIYVPETPDNVNFFTVAYHRGLDWYEATYFADVADELVVGEFSNSYMVHEPAMQRISRDLPNVRMTMTIRNPIERVYLQWGHTHLKKKLGFDPDAGIGIPLERVVHHHGHAWFRLYVEPGLYAFLLKRLYRYFDREQILVMLHDDLVADDRAFLHRFYEFLGVDPASETSLTGVDVNSDVESEKHALSEELRAELRAVYRDDVAQLEEMLGRNLSHWQ